MDRFQYLLSVPLLQHSMGQITKWHVSICLSVGLSWLPALYYGRNFYSILIKFCTEVGGPKSKNAFVRGSKSEDPSPILAHFFTPVMHVQ